MGTSERRALFDALEEADRRAKGLVFCPIAVAPLSSDQPIVVFASYFVEYRDDAPRPAATVGRFWDADEVEDAIGEEWGLCCAD